MFDKRLLSLVPQSKKYIALNVLCQWIALVANIALMISFALFLQSMLESSASGERLAHLVVAAILAILIRVLAQMLAQRMSFRASRIAKRTIREAIYEKLLRLGPSYTEHVPTNQAVQISTEGVEQLEVYFGSYLPQLVYAVVAPLTLFCFLAPFSLLVACILLICTPLIPISIVAVQKIAKRVTRDYFGHYSNLGGSFLESIQGLTTLKIYQADEAQHKKMNESAETFRRATMRLLRMQLNSITIMDLLAFGGAAIGIVLALIQFSAGNITFSGAFAIVFLSAEFFIPMRSLGSLFHTAMNGLAAAEVMFKVLSAKEPQSGDKHIEADNCVFESINLSYSYDGMRRAIDGISLRMPAKGLVGIVGESGSGKTTLAALLAGRISGFEGSLRVGGEDLRSIAQESLTREVSIVSFSSWIFKGTVRENLLMGKPNASDEELWQVLGRCRLAGFLREEGGLDLPLTEAGSNLSGGQRQRLALARVLLHDSAIYIFDEATSNIDAESERVIVQIMRDLAKQKLVIAISHRLSVIEDAKEIYVLDKGMLAESGTHGELCDRGGVYAQLWNQQQELESFAKTEEAFIREVRVQSIALDVTDEVCVPNAAATVTGTGTTNATGATDEVNIDHRERCACGDRGFNGRCFASEETQSHQPANQGKPSANTRSAFSIMLRLVRLVRPLVPYMILAIVLGVLGFGCAIFLTVFGVSGLLNASGLTSITTFEQAIALVVVCGVLRGFLHYGEQICNHYLAFKLLALIRDNVFGALRRLAPAKLEGRDKGNLISLITSDIELLEVFYAHTISPVFIACIVSLVIIGFIAAQSWLLALVAAAAYVVIGVGIPLVFSRGAQVSGRALRDQLGEVNSFVLESLRGLREIIQFGQGEKRAKAVVERSDSLAFEERHLKDRTALSTAVTGACVLLFDTIMIVCAYLLCASGTLSFGQAALSVIALMSSFGPVIAVASLGTTLQQTIASGARVLDLLDEEPECAEVTDGCSVKFTGAALDNVSFSYDKEMILRDVSIPFDAGKVIGISGKSGSGKSTLLKLLMRFWDPSSERVALSDIDLREVNTTCLRNNEGYMTQDTHLFEGTLGENILIAKPHATYEELREACRKASLLHFIDWLPNGFDTPVGELGNALSGGERQRVGLARVFLHDAPFVLLDEPTSNLDSLTEASVLKALARFRKNKTIVLVSHRASTGSFVDISYSIEQGRMS